jgi:hypothetical protein
LLAEVLERLRELDLAQAKGQGVGLVLAEGSVFRQELRFFEKHGNAGRLAYAEFRAKN